MDNMIRMSSAGLLGLATLLLLVQCKPKPDRITRELAGRALIVDVRTRGEFKGDHYPGAVNIPVAELANRMGELGAKNRPIIVYCRSGRRSGRAKRMLKKAGFRRVYNGGGLKDMRAKLR